MNLGLGPLLQRLADGAPDQCVLATVTDTEGSSYRKAGAMMLLCDPLPPVGLVSGGCLESDLAEHAKAVLQVGVGMLVTYDLSRDEDALWGLGIGCGGKISVLLERIGRTDGYGGLAAIGEHWRAGRFCWLLKRVDESSAAGNDRYAVIGGEEQAPPAFAGVDLARADRSRASRPAAELLLVPVDPPPRLVVCGAGPDALPLARFAVQCGWRVEVFDHRPAYARPDAFPAGVAVTCATLAEFARSEAASRADAAVVMSHHLENDAAYARALAASRARYIGILGPRLRREEVLERARVEDRSRFRGPAGLDIGADLPETIALSILAEAHAELCGRSGGPLIRSA